MAPTDIYSPAGSSSYFSNTMYVGDGTWIASKNTFLFPNLVGMNFETMRYNGMGNRFASLPQYHKIIKGHGILAVFTFLFLVPAAIMIAQFSFGSRSWALRLHIYLQVLTILLSTAIFTLGWFAVGPSRTLTNPHHGIGLAIYALILLQGIFGYFIYRRSNNQSPKKLPLSVMLHEWVGKATALLGLAQVPLGLTLYGSPLYTFVLYALWMAVLLVIYFILKYRARPLLYDGGMNRAHEETISQHTNEDLGQNQPKSLLAPFVSGACVVTTLRDKFKRQNRSNSLNKLEENQIIRQNSQAGSGSYFENEKQRSNLDRNGIISKLGKLTMVSAVLDIAKNKFGKEKIYREEDRHSSVSLDVPPRPHERNNDDVEFGRATASATRTREGWPRLSISKRDSRNPIKTTSFDIPEHHTVDIRSASQQNPNYSENYSDEGTNQSVHREENVLSFKDKLLAAIGIGSITRRMSDSPSQGRSEREWNTKHKIGDIKRTRNSKLPSSTRSYVPHKQAIEDSSNIRSDSSISEDVSASDLGVRKIERNVLLSEESSVKPPQGQDKFGLSKNLKMPDIQLDRHGVSCEESNLSDMKFRRRYSHNISETRYQRQQSSLRGKDLEVNIASSNDQSHRQVSTVESSKQAVVSEISRHPETVGTTGQSSTENSGQTLAIEAARQVVLEQEERQKSRSRVTRVSASARDGLETTISVKVKVHEDNNHVTLRRLTDEEIAAEKEANLANRRWRRVESISSISARDTAASQRRYRRSESETGRQPEYLTQSTAPTLARTPSNGPTAGRRPVDSAYYPKRESCKNDRLSAVVGSPESYNTWSAMSPSNDDNGEAAAERRRRRRYERSQKSGLDDGLTGQRTIKNIDNSNV